MKSSVLLTLKGEDGTVRGGNVVAVLHAAGLELHLVLQMVVLPLPLCLQPIDLGLGEPSMGQSDGYGLVLAHAGLTEGDVVSLSVKREYDDGRLEYEVKFWVDTTEYEYTVDGATGDIRLTDRETTSPSVKPAWARAASFAPCSPMSAPEGAPPEGAEPRLSCWDFTTAPVRASMSYSYSLPLA